MCCCLDASNYSLFAHTHDFEPVSRMLFAAVFIVGSVDSTHLTSYSCICCFWHFGFGFAMPPRPKQIYEIKNPKPFGVKRHWVITWSICRMNIYILITSATFRGPTFEWKRTQHLDIRIFIDSIELNLWNENKLACLAITQHNVVAVEDNVISGRY